MGQLHVQQQRKESTRAFPEDIALASEKEDALKKKTTCPQKCVNHSGHRGHQGAEQRLPGKIPSSTFEATQRSVLEEGLRSRQTKPSAHVFWFFFFPPWINQLCCEKTHLRICRRMLDICMCAAPGTLRWQATGRRAAGTHQHISMKLNRRGQRVNASSRNDCETILLPCRSSGSSELFAGNPTASSLTPGKEDYDVAF